MAGELQLENTSSYAFWKLKSFTDIIYSYTRQWNNGIEELHPDTLNCLFKYIHAGSDSWDGSA